MKIALIGYGKMGKEIEKLAPEYGASIQLKLDIDAPPLSKIDFQQIDVVIHFAIPSCTLQHIDELSKLGKHVVVGTTGWYDDLQKVQSIVEKTQIGLIYASNFSLGVNAFFHLVKKAGTIFNRFPEYDPFIQEIHHTEKLDAPSGTALTLGKILLQEIERKKQLLISTPEGKIKPEQLQIASVRGGSVIGTHSVLFDSTADTLELTHTAKNRTGFARGALLAAKWIVDKKGLFTMDDLFSDISNI